MLPLSQSQEGASEFSSVRRVQSLPVVVPVAVVAAGFVDEVCFCPLISIYLFVDLLMYLLGLTFSFVQQVRAIAPADLVDESCWKWLVCILLIIQLT